MSLFVEKHFKLTQLMSKTPQREYNFQINIFTVGIHKQ